MFQKTIELVNCFGSDSDFETFDSDSERHDSDSLNNLNLNQSHRETNATCIRVISPIIETSQRSKNRKTRDDRSNTRLTVAELYYSRISTFHYFNKKNKQNSNHYMIKNTSLSFD